jgi:hypothetical protein
MLDSRVVHRRGRGEEGQVLIMWILIATIIFVIGAIVVDFGLWFTERRRAQTAADLAAIAAATMLDDSNAQTVALALDYADRNGYTHDAGPGLPNVVVTPQYNGNPELVEVTVEDDAPVLFLDIFGVAGDIGARAVAELTEQSGSGTEYAIFANNSDCTTDPPPIDISGSDNVAVGAVHSNSDYKAGGQNNMFDGPVTWGGGTPANRCDVTPGGNNYDSGYPLRTGTQPMPLNYTYNSFSCDYTHNGSKLVLKDVAQLWQNRSARLLQSWTICSTGDIEVDEQGTTGTVTLVAQGNVTLNGSDFNLTGKEFDVLIYSGSSSTDAIRLSGSNGQFTGFIFAPNGRITMSGSSNTTLHGSLIGDRVTVNGSGIGINATGFPVTIPQPPTIKLVE